MPGNLDKDWSFESVFDASDDSIFIQDLQGTFLFVNRSVERIYGYPRNFFIGKTPAFFSVPQKNDLGLIQTCFESCVSHGTTERFEYWALRADGSEFLKEVVLNLGQFRGESAVIAIARNITERKEEEAVLIESGRLFFNVFEFSPIAMAISRIEDGLYYNVNKAWLSLMGYSESEVVGKTVFDLGIYKNEHDRLAILEEAEKHGCVNNREIIFQTKNHQEVTVLFSLARTVLGGGTCNLLAYIDITERKNLERDIAYLASHDALTDIPNRALLMDRLSQAMARADRDSTKAAVLFVDLDNFKSVNDKMGHMIGDQVLKQMAGRMMSCLRKTDTVARFGGDEFVVLMTDVKTADDAVNMARALNRSLSEPVSHGNNEVILGASIGIVLYPDDAQGPEALLSLADTAMYEAKRCGKENYRFSKRPA